MGRVSVAFRAFFKALADSAVAERIELALSGVALPAPAATVPQPTAPTARQPAPVAKKPAQSEALTLLAALQREARFVDFVKEPLGSYSDAQIGAAARDVHRDCGAVLERLFALQPVSTAAEGADVTVGESDAPRYHLVGNVTGQPPYRGKLRHPGWAASKADLPAWTGAESAARIVAPAEVEVST